MRRSRIAEMLYRLVLVTAMTATLELRAAETARREAISSLIPAAPSAGASKPVSTLQPAPPTQRAATSALVPARDVPREGVSSLIPVQQPRSALKAGNPQAAGASTPPLPPQPETPRPLVGSHEDPKPRSNSQPSQPEMPSAPLEPYEGAKPRRIPQTVQRETLRAPVPPVQLPIASIPEPPPPANTPAPSRVEPPATVEVVEAPASPPPAAGVMVPARPAEEPVVPATVTPSPILPPQREIAALPTGAAAVKESQTVSDVALAEVQPKPKAVTQPPPANNPPIAPVAAENSAGRQIAPPEPTGGRRSLALDGVEAELDDSSLAAEVAAVLSNSPVRAVQEDAVPRPKAVRMPSERWLIETCRGLTGLPEAERVMEFQKVLVRYRQMRAEERKLKHEPPR